MNSKIIIIILATCLIVGLTGDLLYFFSIVNIISITSIAGIIGRIGAIILLLASGTLIKEKRLFPVILIAGGLFLIGAWLKIVHRPNADMILFAALIIVPLTYTIHFFKKTFKKLNDILKLVWVTVMALVTALFLFHQSFRYEAKVAEGVLFLVMFFHFSFTYYFSSQSADKY